MDPGATSLPTNSLPPVVAGGTCRVTEVPATYIRPSNPKNAHANAASYRFAFEHRRRIVFHGQGLAYLQDYLRICTDRKMPYQHPGLTIYIPNILSLLDFVMSAECLHIVLALKRMAWNKDHCKQKCEWNIASYDQNSKSHATMTTTVFTARSIGKESYR